MLIWEKEKSSKLLFITFLCEMTQNTFNAPVIFSLFTLVNELNISLLKTRCFQLMHITIINRPILKVYSLIETNSLVSLTALETYHA